MKSNAGLTLVELLATLALVAVVIGVGALYLNPFKASLDTAAKLTDGYLRLARSTAMASTSAYNVKPESTTKLIVETADSCSSASWTVDPDLELELPRGVLLTSTAWNACFTSGGKSTGSVTIELWSAQRGTVQIEVLQGGATRIIE